MTEATESKPTRCLTAHVSARAYTELVESGKCGDGVPCMRDDCEHCADLNMLIDLLGAECEKLGCTLRQCVHDDQ